MLVIEIDGPTNGQVKFFPAELTLRGRFDIMRMNMADCYKLLPKFPQGIPGQRIELDEERAIGVIVEPLHLDENKHIKKAVETYATGKQIDATGKGFVGELLPPARRVFEKVHVPTWAYWMKRIVEAKQGKKLQGAFQEEYPDAKREFGITLRQPDQRDGQIKQLNNTVDLLTKMLLAKLTPAERKELERLQQAAA